MTATDMDALSYLMAVVPQTQLHKLDEARFPWLPRVKGRRSMWINKAVRGGIEACQVPLERLKRLAWFYCWMAPLRVLRPWTLFHLSIGVALSNPITVLERLESALQILGRETASVATDEVTAILGCILVADAVPVSLRHDVVCVCLWRRLPCMAIYAPAASIHSELSVALAAVMDCNPEDVMRGIYWDLGSAYIAALSVAGASAGTEGSSWKA